MSINLRSAEVRRSHGESLVKLGEKLQESVIYALFLTPFIYFGKALFEGGEDKAASYIKTVLDSSDFLMVLLGLMALSVVVGIIFKNKGYDFIESANNEINT